MAKPYHFPRAKLSLLSPRGMVGTSPRSATTPGWIPPVTGLIDMGVRDTGAFLNGALDDVRVYDPAITP